jgi:hypothetical protein
MVRVRVVVGGFPVDHVHGDPERLHAGPVDQHVERGLELAAVPGVRVDVDAQRGDLLVLVAAIDRDRDARRGSRRSAGERDEPAQQSPRNDGSPSESTPCHLYRLRSRHQVSWGR